jgi:hypothetical protein
MTPDEPALPPLLSETEPTFWVLSERLNLDTPPTSRGLPPSRALGRNDPDKTGVSTGATTGVARGLPVSSVSEMEQ